MTPRKCLVVEDRLDTAETFVLVLRTLGHEAEYVTDPLMAFEAARRLRPDVAFLDIGLPKMTGYELAQRLKSEFPGLCLVAVTGYGLPEYQKRGREAGFHAYLPKPADIEAIQEILANLFE